jgi:hypothetical protein
MRKIILPLFAALLFCVPAFFSGAQETEVIDTGRFGAEEPEGEDSGVKTYKNHILFLGARLGPSMRFYTPSGDTVLTGGSTNSFSMDIGAQASVQIFPLLSLQAEMIFTWDTASVWHYALNSREVDLDRYTVHFTGSSLQFPLIAKLNFYPGKFRVSPFAGAYFLVPLGQMNVESAGEEAQSFAYEISPPVGLLGGFNAAYPLGPGMFFADIRYAADLGKPELADSGEIKTYYRHGLSLSLGFEFGFFKKR